MNQLLDSASPTIAPPRPQPTPATRPEHGQGSRRRPRRPRGLPADAGERSTAQRISEPEPRTEKTPTDSAQIGRIAGGHLLRADDPGLSSQERRRRLEAIVLKLAETPSFNSRLSEVYKRHTRREINAAAALRPDLMPTINGEFEHFAFFRA